MSRWSLNMENPEKEELTFLSTLANIINEKTKKGLYNAGDLTLTRIADVICKKYEEDKIDSKELLSIINGLSYEKDLTKYMGRTRKVRFKFTKE